ncbi:MAG: hypothetical protein KDD94_08320, partial [Calditrichaeota bacterium]|nr:hypothetical protein [Calditrichota bacterium]
DQSIDWLKSQLNSNWNLAKDHPEYGSMTASQFLANWLAHDYLHMRQILKVKFAYLRQRSGQELNYAGPW